MKFKVTYSIIFSFVFLIFACERENNETKFPVVKINFCDTISYSKHIKPIINASCNTSPACHATGSLQGDFSTYITTQPHIPRFRQRLIIDKDMPKGSGPLPQAQLELFGCWLDAGAKNN